MIKINNEQSLNKEKQNNTAFYFKVAGVSAVSFLLIIYLLISTVMLFAPLSLAKFYDSMNLDALSYSARDVAYRNSNKTSEKHFMLTNSIYQKNYGNIIYYTERMFSSSDFPDYMLEVDGINFSENFGKDILTRISTASESNYIKGEYVNALYKKNRKIDAVNFAIKNLKELKERSVFNKTSVFLLPKLIENGHILSNSEVSLLSATYEKCKDTEAKYSETVNGILSVSRSFEKKVMKARLSEMAIMLYDVLDTEKYKIDYDTFLKQIIA